MAGHLKPSRSSCGQVRVHSTHSNDFPHFSRKSEFLKVCARVVLNSNSSGHATVHSDSGSRAWGSGGCARCVEQQQHDAAD